MFAMQAAMRMLLQWPIRFDALYLVLKIQLDPIMYVVPTSNCLITD